MPQLRIALAQINTTVGDLEGNCALIERWTAAAAAAGARLVLFPEMAVTGYPVEDLALRPSFVAASVKTTNLLGKRLAEAGLGEVVVVVGYLDHQTGLAPRVGLPAGAPLDGAAVLHHGSVVVTSAKHHLPNYGVFDEYRHFVPGDVVPVLRLAADSGEAVDVAVAICEDLWQDGGPVAVTRQAGAGLLAVVNASPYEQGKDDVRLDLVTRRAAEAGVTLAYVNAVGGQDELVFDGDSLIADAAGTLLARGPQFDEALIIADLELPAATPAAPGDVLVNAQDGTMMTIRRIDLTTSPAPPISSAPPTSGAPSASAAPPISTAPAIPAALSASVAPAAPPAALAAEVPDGTGGPCWPRLDEHAEVYAALVTGVRDYVSKNGFKSVILGLSGGIDSALTATIAADAIGPERVHVVLMPGPHSSEHSISDAADLAERQGLPARTVPIQPMFDAFQSSLQLEGLAAENLQARVRGMVLMSLSNAEGHLVLTTGNKSELATGYSTLYGDSAGGFGPIKDVPKTMVWELARWRNAQAEQAGQRPPIPENSITKPPSAELRPGQLDTDSLPDYALLDPVLAGYVEHDLGAAELLAAGHQREMVEQVVALVDRAEYKRRQYPPGPKITGKNFGRDRRLPITSRWREPLS